jgi:hypothetical protein
MTDRSRKSGWRDDLDDVSTRRIAEVMNAILDGPFLGDDRNFAVVMGTSREVVRSVARRWPFVDDELVASEVVVNSLRQLLSYPHHQHDAYKDYLSADSEDYGVLLQRIVTRVKNDPHHQEMIRARYTQRLNDWPSPELESDWDRRMRPFWIAAAKKEGAVVPEELRRRPE